MAFKIEGLLKKPRWYDIKCSCDHSDTAKEYPIAPCLHCKFQHQEDLMPRKSFKITMSVEDKNKKVHTETFTCNKIKINRGTKYEEILGWFNIVG